VRRIYITVNASADGASMFGDLAQFHALSILLGRRVVGPFHASLCRRGSLEKTVTLTARRVR
ncbi:MAG: hypothetical protein ACKO6R_00355, partial [Burkholderiaceae bacterium]